jgi:hypothetical protein
VDLEGASGRDGGSAHERKAGGGGGGDDDGDVRGGGMVRTVKESLDLDGKGSSVDQDTTGVGVWLR